MFNKDKLFSLLEKENNSIEFKKIAKIMNVKIKNNKEFSSFLFDLVNKKEIFMDNARKYYRPIFLGKFEGVIKIVNKNFGFVDLDENNSVFILSSSFNSAFNEDKVEVKYFKDNLKKDSFQGIVTKVLERNVKSFVGKVVKFQNNFGIIPFNKKIFGKFRFINTKDLQENQELKVEIIDFSKPFIKIKKIKNLGFANDPFIDISLLIEDANVPIDFSKEAIEKSKTIPLNIDNENKEKRVDLTKEMIFTIDGDDTKDFDDAISIKKLENGNYLLFVHIADVSHYVKENDPIDKDARERSTSIYLVDRVIPMLPESLSNGICSLKPNVNRFAITCQMEIDSNGNNISNKIFPSIINSKYRLTYKEVNDFFKNKKEIKDLKLKNSLNLSLELSKILRKYKNNQGYIDFEISESKIIVDKNGKTKNIVLKERFLSEILIEDFMVRTNEVVAKFIEDMKLSFIYRVHDKPDMEKIISLENVVKLLGLNVKIPKNPSPKNFSESINEIKNKRFDDFIKLMMLRTMSKAKYSSDNIGHFGLASKSYTHFTSPIRRYSDLMVHRMIREYLFNKNKNLSNHFSLINSSISSHCSIAEVKAVDLERKVSDVKKAEFYEKFIGKKQKGIIVSIMKFGFFVEFPNKVDGLVHVSNLFDGEYELTNSGLTLTNKKRYFNLGDTIEVIIVSANKNTSKIDLVIPEMYNFYKNKNK